MKNIPVKKLVLGKSACKHRQMGVSLIELLISMALGIFFLGVAVQYLVTGQESNRVQDSGSRIQENARFSIGMLRDDFRMAGYVESTAPNAAPVPPFFRGDCEFANPCTSDTANTTGDIVGISFISDAAVNTDCIGNVVAPGTPVVNVYWIQANNGVNSLYCRGRNFNIPGAAGWLPGGAQPIVDGIDSMQVQYGETVPTGFLFVSASNVTNWTNITSARIALLVDTGLQTDSADRSGDTAFVDENTTYALLDAVPIPLNDGRLRRIHSTTIQIIN